MHRQGSGQSLLREQIHRSQRFERKTASFGQKTVLPCFPCAGGELGGKIHSWRTCHPQKIQRQMIARNFCLSFVDIHNGLMSNLSVIFTYGTKKTCQIAVARPIKNKTFSQVLFFVLPLVVGMFAKCHKGRNLHFCFVGEGNFAAPHSENLMTGVVYAKRLGVRVVVV